MNRRTQIQDSKAPNYGHGHLIYLLEGRWGVRWQGWCNKMISPQPWQPPCIGYFDNILVLLFTTRSNFFLLLLAICDLAQKIFSAPLFCSFSWPGPSQTSPFWIHKYFTQIHSLLLSWHSMLGRDHSLQGRKCKYKYRSKHKYKHKHKYKLK